MELIDNEIKNKEININFVNNNGSVCDLIAFKDIDGKVLGMAVVNDKNFKLPEGTVYCDYYHQSFGTKEYITRIVLGDELQTTENEVIVSISSQGKTNKFNAKENVDFVKFASNKEDFLVQIINETMSNMTLTKEEEQTQKKR